LGLWKINIVKRNRDPKKILAIFDKARSTSVRVLLPPEFSFINISPRSDWRAVDPKTGRSTIIQADPSTLLSQWG
jgi:hypothetical protein